MNTDYSKAIKNVAWSVILTTYHINIGALDVLPDWLGCILLYKAIEPIARFQASANLLKNFSIILIADSVVATVLKLFNLSIDIYIYSVIISVIHIYLNFQLLTDIWHIVDRYNLDSGGLIPLLRNITTVTFTITFVLSSVGGNIFVIYAAAIVNIVMKTSLAIHLFNHAADEKIDSMDIKT